MKNVSMIMLGVADTARSVGFYRDTLGLDLQHHAGEFAFFAAGGVTLALSEQLGKTITPVAGAVEVIFPVDSVNAHQAALRERGCQFVNEPREVTPGSWAATFKDPDGHMLTLFGPQ